MRPAAGAVTLVAAAGSDGELMKRVRTLGVGCIQFLPRVVGTLPLYPDRSKT